MKNKHRVIFFGTPWIAKQCLLEILKLDVDVVAIICQPDKARDRKKNIIFNDVKKVAIEKNILIIQEENINHHVDQIKKLNPDLIITCAFGQFISEEILSIPKYKAVNIHASLLPKLRGGAPIHRAIINGEQETGITFMHMIKKMDAGDIFFQESIKIDKNECYDSLLIKLAHLACEMINKYFYQLFDENLVSIPQNENEVTYGLNIKKVEELINFDQMAVNICHLIRGLWSKPSAKFIYESNSYRVCDCHISSVRSSNQPGVITGNDQCLQVATKDFDIIFQQIQPPNRNWMDIKDFLNGNNIFKLSTLIGMKNE